MRPRSDGYAETSQERTAKDEVEQDGREQHAAQQQRPDELVVVPGMPDVDPSQACALHRIRVDDRPDGDERVQRAQYPRERWIRPEPRRIVCGVRPGATRDWRTHADGQRSEQHADTTPAQKRPLDRQVDFGLDLLRVDDGRGLAAGQRQLSEQRSAIAARGSELERTTAGSRKKRVPGHAVGSQTHLVVAP